MAKPLVLKQCSVLHLQSSPQQSIEDVESDVDAVLGCSAVVVDNGLDVCVDM